MKLSSLSFLAVAGLATASPVRIVVISKDAVASTPNILPHIRYGHALAGMANPIPESWSVENTDHNDKEPTLAPVVLPNLDNDNKPKLHCSGAEGLHSKAFHLANMFRQAFGLPLIEQHRPHRHRPALAVNIEPPTPGEVQIMPFVGRPAEESETSSLMPIPPADANPQDITWFRPTFLEGRPTRHHYSHFRHGSRYRHFIHRINRAFSTLGPWESYAVGFVFGCGLGTLARMIYVLVVVLSRSFTRRNARSGAVSLPETPEEHQEVLVVVPIPQEYVDEKAQPPTYVDAVEPRA